MPRYVNTDYQTRVWPDLKGPDGRTLELGPGQSADVEVPDDFDDPYLKPHASKGSAKPPPSPPATPSGDDQPAPKE